MTTTMMYRLLAHPVTKVIASRPRPLIRGSLHGHRWLFTSLTNQCKPLSSSGDFFQVFALDKKFALNTAELTREFRLLQDQWHPDKFVGRSKEEQDMAARESSFINQAYRTLKDPMKRSLYLLKLTGHSLEEGTTDSDPEFLMEIMELNEKLADVKSHEDVEAIKQENRAVLDDLQRSFAAAYEAKNFPEARKIASRMKYYGNISDKVFHFERERGL